MTIRATRRPPLDPFSHADHAPTYDEHGRERVWWFGPLGWLPVTNADWRRYIFIDVSTMADPPNVVACLRVGDRR
jgi:hypothetical protein